MPLLDLEGRTEEGITKRLKNPPEVFANDDDLGGGYAIWRGSRMFNEGEPVDVAVLLTEPSAPNGLGSLDGLKEIMSVFTVVGYANKRSPIREAKTAGGPATGGGVTPSGELTPDDTYMSMLYDAAADLNKILFSFDPEADFMDGSPVGRTASGLYKVETALRAELIGQDNPADPDASVTVMDASYCNANQWHGMGRSGNELGSIMSEAGMFPDSVLLVVPAEQHHYVHKSRLLGATATAYYAHDAIAEIAEVTSYPMIMDNGFIPRGLIKG